MWRHHVNKVTAAVVVVALSVIGFQIFSNVETGPTVEPPPTLVVNSGGSEATVALTKLVCVGGVCSPTDGTTGEVTTSDGINLESVEGLESVSVTAVQGPTPHPVALNDDGYVDTSRLAPGRYLLTLTTASETFQLFVNVPA